MSMKRALPRLFSTSASNKLALLHIHHKIIGVDNTDPKALDKDPSESSKNNLLHLVGFLGACTLLYTNPFENWHYHSAGYQRFAIRSTE